MHRAAVLLPLLFASACTRPDEPTSTKPEPGHWKRPPNNAPGHAPASGGPPELAAPALPATSRDPDWGLDPADPAKDYVGRYLRATKRYGDKPCVTVGASRFTGNESVVETHNDASGACGKAGELRDRFLVTTATDRMSIDESLHQPRLLAWPDGSEPGGPPKKPADFQNLRGWKTTLHETFQKLELAPLRVQLYGRGTYPVISIAGWHGPVQRTMTPGQLEAPAKALCDANDGEPLGIFAGVDRSVLLRIICPASARFDTL